MQTRVARIQVSEFVKESVLRVRITPSAAKNCVLGFDAVRGLRVSIAAPPEDNKANKELLSFLKKEYKLSFRLISGAKSREKVLQLV